jgi:IMP dehydrogenase
MFIWSGETMQTGYTFNDVLIIPRYSSVLTRQNVCLDTKIQKGSSVINLSFPIISANMASITEEKMAFTIALNGGLGILHRFSSIEENCIMVHTFKLIMNEANVKYDTLPLGASLGVGEGLKRFDKLYDAGVRVFCVDVAHGHHLLVKNMLKELQGAKDAYIIAGNIVTREAAYDLSEWGADCLKVGIGSGGVCVTRNNTGCGYPQLSALENIRAALPNKPLISDGGIVTVGDIAKALVYADMVMVGSFISGTAETPGNVFKNADGKYYKVFQGSASARHKNTTKGSVSFVEGVTKEVPFRGKVKYILREIKEGLQSACSYVGAHDLTEFKKNAEFVLLSSGSMKESKL